MAAAKYNIRVHQKHLRDSIKKLERYKKMFDRHAFLSNEVARDAIRKALEETLEIMITIGNIVIAEKDFGKPDRNSDIFDILAEEKIYPKSLADELWGIGGFRNILVHDYIALDLNLVYDYLEKGIPIFKKYARYIEKGVN